MVNKDPIIRWGNAQGSVHEVSSVYTFLEGTVTYQPRQTLHIAGKECFEKLAPPKAPPTLIVVVLPEGATNLYQAVKQ